MTSDPILYEDQLVIHTTHKSDVEPEKPRRIWNKVFNKTLRHEASLLLQLAWPIALTSALKMGISTQSLVFSGHLGKTELAAATLAVSFINVTAFSIAVGLCSALETLCSQAFGARNLSMVGVFTQRGICILSIAMLLVCAFWINTEHFLVVIGVEPHIARMVDKYIFLSIPLLPAMFGQLVMQRYVQVQGIVRPVMYIGLVVFGADIGLNVLLINVLNLGLSGVAIAYMASFYLNFFLTFLYIWVTKVHRTTWQGWSLECFQGWGQFVGLAFPGMMMLCLQWWSFEIGAFVIGRFGESSLAAHGIVFQIAVVAFMIPLGMSLAAAVRVGNVLGANKPNLAKLITKLSITLTVGFNMIIVCCLIGSKDYVGLAFTENGEVLSLVTKVIPLIGAYVLFDATQGVCSGVVRGCGRQKIGVLINFVSFYVVGLPLGLILAFVLQKGLIGFWWGIVAALLVQATTYVLLISCTNWQQQADMARKRAAITSKTTGGMVTNGDWRSHDPVAMRLSMYHGISTPDIRQPFASLPNLTDQEEPECNGHMVSSRVTLTQAQKRLLL